jgi:hypothetical protein
VSHSHGTWVRGPSQAVFWRRKREVLMMETEEITLSTRTELDVPRLWQVDRMVLPNPRLLEFRLSLLLGLVDVPPATSVTLLLRAVDSRFEELSPLSTPTNEPTLTLPVQETLVVRKRRRDSSPQLPKCSRAVTTSREIKADLEEIRLVLSTKDRKVDGPLERTQISVEAIRCSAVVEAAMIRVTTRIMATW